MLRLGAEMLDGVTGLINSVTGLLTVIGQLMGKTMGTLGT